MKKKWLIAVCMGFMLLFGAAACGSKENTEPAPTATTAVTPTIAATTTPEVTVIATEEGNKEEEPTATPLPTFAPSTPEEIDRSVAFAVLQDINVGWNLGNSLDSHGTGGKITAETYWGNPKTTQEMIDTVSKQGFNTIRIPVTWAEHVGEAPDYMIDEEWLNRVQEVVDYAVANDMYVILDTHHEPDYWMKPTMENYDVISKELTAIWTQIAERFREYDQKLLFEGMNEPRVKGSDAEWNGGTTDNRRAINRLNCDFINAVRAAGGNNETRICIITTYGNNAGKAAMRELYIPNDPYLMVAVHLYTPYFFTYDADGGYSVWDGSHRSEITSAMRQVNEELISRNVPVIITEFGAVSKEIVADGEKTTNEAEVLAWLNDYMTAAYQYGIRCIWWDNNIYNKNGEKFGIFNRKNLTWYSQNIADALVQKANDYSGDMEQ